MAHAATLTWDTVTGDGSTITGGTGTWTDGLGNWNTGSGDTIWNSATPDSAIFGGTAGTVTLGGAVTVGNMVFNSGYTLADGGNALTLLNSTITANTAATISAALGGSTGLTKDGAGALTLSGNSTYTGTTIISGGILSTSALANGGSSSNIGASSNAAANLVLDGGTLQYNNTVTANTDRLFSVGTAGGTISLPVAGTLNFTNTGSIGFNGESGARTLTFGFSNSTFGGIISLAGGIGDNGGATSVVKANTFGTLRLTSDNNTYTGTTTINGGAVSIGTLGGSTGSIGTGAIIINAGGTLVASRSGSVTLAQTISGAGGVTSNGNTMLTLSGTNTYTGVTRIISNGGIVTVSDLGNGGVASSIGASSSAAGNLSITNLGTLRYVGTGASTDRLFEVPTGTINPVATIESSGSGALVFTNTGAMGFGSSTGARTLVLGGTNAQNNTMNPSIGDNVGATALTKAGAGTWILAGANTYTGVTTISGGVLQVGNGGTSGTLGSGAVIDNGNLTFNRSDNLTVANAISGSGSVSKTGTGTTTLTGSNSYTGATTINGGVLNVTNLANGGSNSNIGASSNAAENLVLNGGTLRYSFGAGAAVSTDRLFSVGTSGGTIDASGGFNINFTNTGSMGFNGQSGARTLTLTGNNVNDNTLAAVIGDNGGATSVTKAGGGIWVLSGANTYTGVTTVSGTAVLKVSSLANGGVASNIGASSNAASNLVFNGGTFTYTGGTVSTDRLFSLGTSGIILNAFGTGGVNFTNTGSMGFVGTGARTLTLANSNGGASTIAAVIGDNGGATSVTHTLVSSTWVLTGANTYTGATTLNGGVLSVTSLADGGGASGIGAASSAATNLVLNGGKLLYTGGGSSTDRLFSVGSTGGTLDSSGTGAVSFTNTGSMGFNSQTGTRTLTLTGTNTGANTLAAAIGDNSGATAVAKTGAGTWVLTGTNSYTGATTISGGVLQVGNGGTSGTLGSGAVTDNGNLTFNRSDSITVANTISGSGSVTQAGAGTTTLSGTNSYLGATTISGGVLSVATLANGNSASNIGASSSAATNLVLNGGALRYTGAGVSTDRLFSVGTGGGTLDASGSGALSLTNTGSMGFNSQSGARTLTLTGTNTGSNLLAAVIGESGGATALTKAGAGAWTLSGSNSYTGATTINGGVLNVTSLANGGSSSNIGASSNAASNLVLNGGTLQYNNATTTSTDRLFSVGAAGGTISLPVAATLNFTNTGNIGFNDETGARTLTFAFSNSTFGGIISLASGIGDNGGATSVVKSNTFGTLRLTSDNNTYTGTTTINGGAVAIGNLGGSTGSIGTGEIIINSGGTLVVSRSGSVNLAQTISGAGGVTSNGNTMLTLSGTNTYTGVTRIISNGGVVTVSDLGNGGVASSIGASSSAAGNLSITNLGTLRYVGTGASTDRLFEVPTGTANPVATIESSGSGALVFTNTGAVGFGSSTGARTLVLGGTNTQNNTMNPSIGDNAGATALTKAGTGTWVLAGANTYSGVTTISGGVLQVGNGGTSGTLGSGAVTDNGNLTFNRSDNITVANTISGSGSVSQIGTGTTTLSGTNSYTGVTTINGGVLNVITLANGGSSSNIGASSNAATNLVLNGGTLKYSPGAASAVNTDRLFSVGTSGGTIDASGGFNINFTNTGSMGFNGQSGARTLTLTGINANDNTLAAVIGDNGGATSVTKAGGGIWVLSGASTYTGVTTMSGTGVLKVSSLANGGSASSIGASSNAASNLVLNGGTFMYTGGTVSTDRLFSLGTSGATLNVFGSGAVTFTNTGSMGFNDQTGARTLTLANASGGTSTIAAVIGDNGGPTLLTRINAGIWALTGANTYTGVTSIIGNGGTILNVTNLANGGVASNIGAASSDASNLVLNGGTLQYTGAGSSTDRLFSLGTNGISLEASGTGDLKFTNTGAMGFNGQTGARTLTLIGSSLGFNTLAAVIGDNGGATSVTKLGSGKWVLTGNNTYSGTTTISGGVLQLGHSTASGTAGTGNIVNNGVLVLFRSDAFTLSNVISGTGTVSNAQGAATLSGLNTYTGFTSISAGTVIVGTLANGGSASNIGASTSVANNLQINGGTLKYIGAGVSTDRLFSVGVTATIDASGTGALNFTNTGLMGRSFTLARTLTLTGTNTDNNTLAAIISDNTGATSLVKSGTGTWVLSGANTYTGATTITGGVLSISSLANGGSASGIGAASNAVTNLVLNGGTLQYTGDAVSTSRAFSLGTAAGSALDSSGIGAVNFTSVGIMGFNSQSGARTLTLTGTNTGSNTISILIGDNGGATAITKSGDGTWALTGINGYTGATTISGGVLKAATLFNGGSNSSIGAATSLSTNLVLNGGTLQYTGSGSSTDRLFSVGTNGGTLDASGSAAVNFTNTGSMGFNSQSGARTLTLGGSNTNDNTLAAAIGDNGGATALTKSGAGTWVLSGNSSYTGVTTVSGGSLKVTSLADGGVASNIGAASNAASNLVINGTLIYAGTGSTTDRLFTLGVGGGGLQANGAGAVNFTNTGSIGFTNSGAHTFLLSGTSTAANSLAATIGDNGGATTVQKLGISTWGLSGASSYTGVTSVLGGILNVSNLANGGQNSSIGAATSDAANLVINATFRYVGAATTTDRLFSIGTGTTPTLDASGTGAVAFTNTGNLGLNGSGTRTLTLTGTNTGNNTLSAVIGDNGGATSLTKSGAGTWVLAGENSYTGTTIISAGVLQIGGGGTSGTLGTGAVTDNAALVINRSDAVTLANSIGGTGTFTQAGGGTTTFTGSKSYAGATFVNAGKLQAGAANAFSVGSAVTVASGAVLELNGFNNSIGGLAGAGTVQNGTATGATLNVLGAGTSTFSGVLQDGGSGYLALNKGGTGGTLTLTGSNTYTGGTVVTTGVLSAAVLANGGTASSIGASSNIASNLILNGGTLRYTGAAVSTDRLFTVTTAGGTLDASGTGVVSFTNTGSMGFNSQTGARTLTLTGTGGGGSIAASIDDNGGATSLMKTGAGQWALGGVNGYTGTTTITGGQLAVSSLANGGSASGMGAATSAAANLILNGGVLRYTGAAVSTDRLFSVGTSGGTLDASGAGAVNFTNTGSMGFNGQTGARTLILNGDNTGNNTLAAIIGDNGGATSLIKLASSTWVLAGANTYTGSTRIDLGMLIISSLANGGVASSIGASSNAATNLVLGLSTLKYTGAATSTDRLFSVGTSGGTLDASGTGAVNFTNTGSMGFNSEAGARVLFLQGSNTGNNTIAANIRDSGGFTSIYKNGIGLWVLSGSNLYTGINLINGGTLSVAQLANGSSASNLGASTNAAANLVLNGGALKYTGAATSTDRLFSVGTGGGTLDASGTGAVNFSNTGSMGFNSQSGARTLTLTGTNAGNNTLAAAIGDNGGATSLVKSGTGTWVLTGMNTYTGATTISDGVLRIGNGGTLGTLGSGAVTDNGILVINHSNAILFANSISGSGSLVQQGAGTTTLTGANSYSGSTTISAGVLSVASIANGGNSSNIGASTNAATNLVLNGGTLKYTGATASTDRLFSVGTSGGTLDASGAGALNFTNAGSMGFNSQSGTRTLTLTGTNTGDNTLAAVIGDNGGATSLVKSGAGTWVLTGTNTYTGTTTISGGVLQAGSGSTTGSLGSGAVINNGSLVINRSDDLTLANAISGSGSFTQAGSGTTTLSGTNSYTGATTISAGVLNVTFLANGGSSSNIGAAASDAANLVINGGTLQYSGAADASTDRLFSVGIGSAVIDVTGSGALNFTNTGSMGFNGQSGDRNLLLTGTNSGVNIIAAAIGDFGGATSVSIDGTATWLLTGANTYTGATTVSSGVLQIGGSNLDSAIILGSHATLELNGLNARIGSLAGSGTVQNNSVDAAALTTGGNNTSTTFSGVIQDGGAGALSIVKEGSGTFTLTGANSYTGTTTINAGVLQVGSGGTTGTLGSGAVINNASLIVNRSDALTIANAISGSGSLTQAGAGTTTLTGDNSYSGSTTINAGVLSVAVLADGGSHSNLGASTDAATNLVLNGGTLQYTGGDVSTDRLFSVGTNGGALDASGTGAVNFTNTGSMGFNSQSGIRTLTLTGTNTGDNTLAAVIGDNGGATALTKSGLGTWVLTGNNSNSGITTINAGVLQIGAGGTTGSLGSGAVTDNGSLIINRSDDITVDNAISGSGSLTQAGSGTTTLTGDNGYTGSTTINAGVLSVAVLADGGSNSHLGASTNEATNLVLNGGALQYTGADVSTDRLFSVGTNDGAIDASGTGAVNFTNTGSMGFNGQSGARTLTLTGTNAGSNTLAAVIGDNGGATALTKSGAGTWVLAGANTYTGITIISAGELQVGAGGTTGTLGTGAVINNASLTINRSDALTIANDISGSGVFTQAGSGTTTLTGDNSYSGSTTINAGVLSVSVLADGGASSHVGASTNAASNLVLNGGTLQYTGGSTSTDRLFSVGSSGGTLDASGTGAVNFTNTGSMGFNSQSGIRTLILTGTNTGDNTLAAVIGDNGDATTLTKTGGGTWVLGGANTYTGATTISAGVLQIGGGGTTGSLSASSALSNNGTLAFNRTDAVTQGTDFASVISGSGGVTQAGTGTLKLNGDNTYAGTTNVRAGTLEVTRNNALGTGAAGTTVSSGATLMLNNVNYSTSETLALNGGGAGGGGALRNRGTSSYTGAITAETNASINVGGGILNLTGGLVKDGTVLTITGGGTVYVSGTGISGASASSDLVVDGTTLVVGADSDYNGPTTVQNGAALIANASVTTTQLDLSSDSLLAGTGAITTAVDQSIFINGTFSVGDPGVAATASTFALTTSGSGAVVMGADSVIRLDLFSGAGLGNNLSNATAADSINLHGKLDATAGGTVVIGNPNGMTNFRGGDQWQLVHLNSGDANAGSFAASLALNDSSLHLASGFTSYLDPSDGVFSIIDTNGGLALAAVEVQALVSGGNTVTSDLNGHLFNLRSGGGEEGDDSGSITAALDDGVIVGEGDGDPKKASPIAKRVARSRQWEVFATVNYGNVKLNPIRTQSGVQIDSWASGVGAERHFSRGLTLGFAASFLQSSQGYTSNAGSLHLEGPALSSYVSYVRGSFWNSLLYSFGTYQMDSIRNPGVPFPTAFGTTRTYTHSVQYNAGWNLRFQNNTLVTGPFVGVDYLHGSVDAYNETGGGLAALHYSAQSYQSLVSRVGWSASKQIKAGFGTITPQVRLSYERQNVKNNNGTSVSLINVPFSSTGGQQAPGQDYVVAGLGVNLAFNERFSLMLSYQGQFFRRDLQAHFGSIRFSYQF
ncbi:autotransporter-associated beta strand repeat-containing protein [Prosthecobacter sp.]|uniref:autotransporter-associated beta strand repeat-containing protein n=1 Tax=Prosthecobacter sp. TaxID=1965333 RepID=UPI003782F4D8